MVSLIGYSKVSQFCFFFVKGARSGSRFLPLGYETEYISPPEIRKESKKGNRQSITKGGFFSESAIRFSDLQISKKNIPKNYPELEI